MHYVSCCACERVHFRRVLAWARERGVTDSVGVMEGLGCGRQCGLCLPFIDYALRTGEESVPSPCPELGDESD